MAQGAVAKPQTMITSMMRRRRKQDMAVSVIIKDENGKVVNEIVADVVLVRGLKYLSPFSDGPESARSILDIFGEIRGWAIPKIMIGGSTGIIKEIVKQAMGKYDKDAELEIRKDIIEEFISESEG